MNKKLVFGTIGSLCLLAFLGGSLFSGSIGAQSDSLFNTPPISFPSFTFSKNISFGNSSQDIKQLQIFLNSDPSTIVATSGVGSVGNESTFFGQLTRQAVMRFQEKYRQEVLVPYDIPSPTGFVGVATRKKINELIAKISTAGVPASSLINATSSLTLSTTSVAKQLLGQKHLPKLYTIRPQQIKKGDTFTLVGAGFQTDNTLRIGSFVFNHVLPQDDSNISFTIPATSAITNGTYVVSVENSKGNSQMAGQDISLVITDNPQSPPVISGVVQSTVSLDGVVTINGSGFASSNNSLVSRFGDLENVSSNGTQIVFIPRILIKPEILQKIPIGSTIDLDFYVVNSAGVSNVKGSVKVKI